MVEAPLGNAVRELAAATLDATLLLDKLAGPLLAVRDESRDAGAAPFGLDCRHHSIVREREARAAPGIFSGDLLSGCVTAIATGSRRASPQTRDSAAPAPR